MQFPATRRAPSSAARSTQLPKSAPARLRTLHFSVLQVLTLSIEHIMRMLLRREIEGKALWKCDRALPELHVQCSACRFHALTLWTIALL